MFLEIDIGIILSVFLPVDRIAPASIGFIKINRFSTFTHTLLRARARTHTHTYAQGRLLGSLQPQPPSVWVEVVELLTWRWPTHLQPQNMTTLDSMLQAWLWKALYVRVYTYACMHVCIYARV